MKKTFREIIMLLTIGLTVLIGQKVKLGSEMDIMQSIPGMLVILLVALLSVKIKELLSVIKIPAFAWASLIGLILSMPYCPINKWFLDITSKVDFLAIGTVILAIAGISVGNKLDDLKRLSWKMVIVSFIVFTGTFFGSAIVSQVILKFKGLI